jgi:membrane-associated protease RseP (regulator of RpoE activity)
MYEIIVFILVLSFLVLIHEMGHYLLARKNKINIKEFGLGYPPRLVKLFTYQGTVFSLNAIPLVVLFNWRVRMVPKTIQTVVQIKKTIKNGDLFLLNQFLPDCKLY